MEDILIPVSVCVVLPVAIVLIVSLTAMNSENKRARILIKALEVNNNIDADKLAESLRKPRKTEREIINRRLQRGCTFSLVGIMLLIVSLVPGVGFDADEVGSVMIVGGISVAIGISYLIVYFVTRRQFPATPDEK